jgi:hypothetical protein
VNGIIVNEGPLGVRSAESGYLIDVLDNAEPRASLQEQLNGCVFIKDRVKAIEW